MHYGVFPHVNRSVEVSGVQVAGLPDGLEVVEINAVPTGGTATGAARGDIYDRPDTKYRRHAVDGIRLTPGVPRWHFIVSIRANEPGTFRTEGLIVEFKDGLRSGHQHYRQHLEVAASS